MKPSGSIRTQSIITQDLHAQPEPAKPSTPPILKENQLSYTRDKVLINLDSNIDKSIYIYF